MILRISSFFEPRTILVNPLSKNYQSYTGQWQPRHIIEKYARRNWVHTRKGNGAYDGCGKHFFTNSRTGSSSDPYRHHGKQLARQSSLRYTLFWVPPHDLLLARLNAVHDGTPEVGRVAASPPKQSKQDAVPINRNHSLTNQCPLFMGKFTGSLLMIVSPKFPATIGLGLPGCS